MDRALAAINRIKKKTPHCCAAEQAHKSPDDECSDDFVSESRHFIISDRDVDRSVGIRCNSRNPRNPRYYLAVAGFDDGVGEGFCFISTTLSALPKGLFLARSTRIGAATNTDE